MEGNLAITSEGHTVTVSTAAAASGCEFVDVDLWAATIISFLARANY